MTTRGKPQRELATVNWATAFNALGDAACLLDGEGTVQQCNEALSRLLDLPPGQILGRKCQELMPVASPRPPTCPFAKSRETRRQETLELRSGERWFSVIVDPIITAAGEFWGAVYRLSDITDRKRAEESLRQANSYNRSLIEASPAPLVMIGPEDTITDVNSATEAVTGRSRRELIGTDFSEYFTQPELARAVYQRVFEERSVRDYPLEIRHRDGRLTPVLYCASVYRDESGQVVGVFAAARDVTRLRQTEESLRLSEQRVHLHVQQTAMGVIEWSTDYRVVGWNPAAEQIFGYPAAEALGQPGDFIVPDGARGQTGSIWNRLLSNQRGGERSTNENVTKSGQTILCEWHNTPLTTSTGEVVGVASIVQDVTERRRVERERELEDRRLQGLLKISQRQDRPLEEFLDFALQEVLAISESELGFIGHYSEERRVLTMHAFSKAAMQACRIPDPPNVFILDETALWGEAIRRRGPVIINDYLAPDQPRKGCPAGHAPLFRFLAVPAFSEGRIVALAAVANKASDYTTQDARQLELMLDTVWKVIERKRAEAALTEAKAAAEVANRAKSDFLTNVSHELRTPLHAILGMTELALRDRLSPTVRAYLQSASDSAELLLELINQILDFSRMEAGRMTLEAIDFNLSITLNHEMKALAVRAQNEGLEFCLDLPRHVPTHVIGDPLRLRQILTNLIGNAIKFTERGEVVVRVAVESCVADTVVLRFSVTDTGIGISREDQRKIFVPFSQLDPSATRRHSGTGLGLSIASALARLMGGRLEVDSEAGRGSTFSLTVPFRLPSDFAEPSPLEIAFRGQLQDLPVLVVARDATNRQILCEMLKGWGMKPAPADGARTALAQAQQALAAGRPFPLAIVDSDLADLDGWDLIRGLRQHQRRRAAAIVLVSGEHHQGQVKRRRPAARVQSLIKPVSQEELLQAVVHGLGLVAAPASKPTSAALPLRSPRSLRLLLAEDTAAGRLFATEVLTERGHVVQTVEDGRQALESVRDRDFDVVLMDVQMPTLDGFQTTAAIRSLPDPAKSRVPIVALTAHAVQGYEARCLAAGMNGYLSKPLRGQTLIETVERLAVQPGSDPPAALGSGSNPAPEPGLPTVPPSRSALPT